MKLQRRFPHFFIEKVHKYTVKNQSKNFSVVILSASKNNFFVTQSVSIIMYKNLVIATAKALKDSV